MPTTHRLETPIYHTTFGRNEPALSIASGDTVIAETRDARGNDKHGTPLTDSMKPQADGVEYSTSNPLVGPVYVQGAEPGDALAVHIEKIELNRPDAWSSHSPNFGSLTGEQSARRLLLNDPLPRKLFNWSLDLERRVGILELSASRLKRITLPLHPFIGSMGVAPRYGRVETALTPGEYGGNMDCVETREGTTVYFPVWARGAYLAFGDIHAAQGDGEVCGSALETTAQVTLRIEIKKNWAMDWPRMEDSQFLMTTGSLHSLLDAVRVAQVDMLNWLVQDLGFERWEGWQVISQACTMRIGNIVDPNYTVVVKFPKALLDAHVNL
jgi:amidase